MPEFDESVQFEYASHMPVIQAVLAHFQPKTILEFGTGLYSTPLLVNELLVAGAERVVSIEQSDPEWMKRIEKGLDDIEGFSTDYIETATEAFERYGDISWDLIFVDGETAQRRHCINLALESDCPVVMFHDSEKVSWYGYDRIVKPGHYFHCHYMNVLPDAHQKCTCLITHAKDVLNVPYHQPVNIDFQPHNTIVLP